MPGYLPYPVATAEPGLCGYKDNSEGALRRSGRPWRLTDGSFSDSVPAEQDELGTGSNARICSVRTRVRLGIAQARLRSVSLESAERAQRPTALLLPESGKRSPTPEMYFLARVDTRHARGQPSRGRHRPHIRSMMFPRIFSVFNS